MNELETISPLDGRYGQQTKALANIFSEQALMKYRLIVEVEYLIALSENSATDCRKFSKEEIVLLKKLCQLSLEDAKIIKAIETDGYENIPATNHDLKAIEYFIKIQLKNNSLKDSLEWVHFALTSEDTNNIAYSLMLADSIENIILPTIEKLQQVLEELAQKYKSTPMLARTHGQAASPTTLGKEFKVFSQRLDRQLVQLRNTVILAKLNGATGNYNAHYLAYPKINWPEFTKEFIEKFNKERKIKLKPNLITTQIESHDSYIELFDNLRRINTILLDTNQDMWRYISDGYLSQKIVSGEVGSSTMPHKINPIDFENSEGNLGLANALFTYFATKLPISRLQRDLSDSTVERNFGVAFSHSLIGYKSLLKGLGKITVNEKIIIEELERHPEVISEATQTILRREGINMPYEKLKELSRGNKTTMDDFRKFIDDLDISDEIKKELHELSPKNYLGIAELLADY
ncbi:MAG: adenylosuccinate lyase [Patescibacteria group bacterium]